MSEDSLNIEKLIEMANMTHPNLKFIPLKLENVKTTESVLESNVEDAFGMLGTMHSTTISALMGNGGERKSVAISLLISVVDVYETTDVMI